jgi:Uma2 family endonuclease
MLATSLHDDRQSSTLGSTEQRTCLHHISWQLFEQLLAEIGDDRVVRLAYYQGILEFMTPLFAHKQSNRLIERVVNTLVEEKGLECTPAGSMTIKRADLLAGKEPDSCFYIQNEQLVRGKVRLDFSQDPPPDLAVEVDITHSAIASLAPQVIDQLALYAILGVPELWLYDGQVLTFYQLQDGVYAVVGWSPTFPELEPARVLEFLVECRTVGVSSAVRSLRQWIRLTSSDRLA